MKNFVQSGRLVDLTAPSGGVIAGNTYKIGAFIGVATITVAAGASFPMAVEGIFDSLAEGAVSGQAWAEGDSIYWDNTAFQFTKTSSSNTLAGIACAAKLTAGVLGRIKLVPKAG